MKTEKISDRHLGLIALLAVLLSGATALGQAAGESREPFSGPQPGEKLPPLEVALAYGDDAGQIVDLTQQAGDRAILLVMVNGWNRPAAGLTRILANFAEFHRQELFAAVVLLDADRSGALLRLKQAVSWWKVGGPVGVSVDGPEGPGSYGLNREVNVTVLIAKGRLVIGNYALVQPSEMDSLRILEQVVSLVGGRVPSEAEIVWLSFPTAKLPDAKFRSASADVQFRRLMCELLAASDASQAKSAAHALESYVAEDPQRRQELAAAAAMLLDGRPRPVIRQGPWMRYLQAWRN